MKSIKQFLKEHDDEEERREKILSCDLIGGLNNHGRL
jgi:hypothetical protein